MYLYIYIRMHVYCEYIVWDFIVLYHIMYVCIWQCYVCLCTSSRPMSFVAGLNVNLLHVLCVLICMCCVWVSVGATCRTWSVLCAGCRLCDVSDLVRAMCRRWSPVQDVVCVMYGLQPRTSPLCSERASRRSVGCEQQGTAREPFLSSKQTK